MEVRPAAGRWTAVAFIAVAVAGLPAVAEADTTRAQAAKKALNALDVRKGDDGIIVFGDRRSVRAGAVITQAGPDGLPRTDGRTPATLAKAGVRSIRAGGVMTAVARSWLFYADEGPNQSFEHPGKVVLVERESGEVHVSDRLRWVPLVDGRRPAFFRSSAAYQGKRYRVYERPWKQKSTPLASAAALSAAARDAQKRLADALAAERSCAVRISDTLGDFYDFGRVDKTRAAFGRIFKTLGRLNDGFRTGWYSAAAGRTPIQTTQSLIDRGCQDVLVYVAGGALRSGSAVIGLRSAGGGRLQWHALGVDALEGLVRRNPAVRFKLVFDVPFAGRFADALASERNVTVLLTAGGRDEQSFTYLPQVIGPTGLVRNTQNPFQLLEFTNGVVRGLDRLLSDASEMDRIVAKQAVGRDDTALGLMLARALDLGPTPFSSWLTGQTKQRLPLAPTSASSSSPINHTPFGTTPGQTVSEDTPADLTLTATDADGDPLTFTVTGPPAHGTLTGAAPFLRYAPAADFNGADQLTYRVSDGRGGTDEKTVAIAVSPENDTPTVVPGTPILPPTYTENAAPVALDPLLTIVDIDSAQLTGARVTIGAGRVAGDELAFTPGGGISGSYDAGTGVLTLTGTASVTAYRDALRSVTFASASDDPDTARTIGFRAIDSGGQGPAFEQHLTVVHVNDAPALALPAAQGVEEDGSLDVPAIDYTDPDERTGPVEATLGVDDGTLTLGTTAGLTFGTGDGTDDTDVAFTGTPAQVRAALADVTYAPDLNFTGDDDLDVEVDDLGNTPGPAASDTGIVDITVGPINDPPVNTVPGAQTSGEDANLTMTGEFSIADLDAAAGSLTTELEVDHGRLVVAAGGSVTDNVTDHVTIEGTVAQVNASLATVEYQPTGDYNGDDTITVTTNDNGNTGSGGDEIDTDTVAVTITAANDAPVMHVPGAQTTAEDTPLTFDSALHVTDVDAGTGDLVLTATTTAGLLDADATTADVTGDGTGSVTVTGTLAEIDAALDGLVYTPVADDDTSATLTFAIDDQGNTGAGGAKDDTETVAVDLTPVNDAPRVTTSAGDAAYTENGAPVVIDDQLGLTDPDDADLEGATVTIGGFRAGDELVFVNTATISGVYNTGTGKLTLIGTDSVADYQAALRSVKFTTPSDDPGTARTLTYEVDDGDDAGSATRDIAITPVNDAPTVALSGGTAAFTENGAAVAIDPGASVADADDTHLESATIDIAAGHDAATDVLAFTDTADITVQSWTPATGTLVLTGSAAKTDWQDALRAVTFEATGDAVTGGARTIVVTVDDGDLESAPVSRGVGVTATNDKPVVTTSAGGETHTEGGPDTVVDDGVGITDADGTTTLNGARVKISDGTRQTGDALALTGAPGTITVTAYNPGSGELVLSGVAPIDDYRDALRAVTFTTANDDPTTSRSIGFWASDATEESDLATRSLTIAPTNDAPEIELPASPPSTNEDTDRVLDGIDAISIADPDVGGADLDVALGVTNGTLDLAAGSGVTITGGANGTSSVQFDGTLSEANAALNGLTYHPAADFSGDATLTVAVEDGGATGAGGNGTDTENHTITVNAVNDKPVVTTTGGATGWTEGTAATAIDAGLTVTDVDDADIESATVAITTNAHTGDELTFTNSPLFTETYSAGTRTLTLTGTATKAQYEAYLRTVAFRSTSPTPTSDTRTIEFTVGDGALSSDVATKQVAVTEINSAPVVTASGGAATFTEDGAPVAVDGGLTVTDADSPTLVGATVTIDSAAYDQGADTLEYTTTHGITGSFDPPSGTLTLTGTKTPAEYQDALRAVQFDTTAQNPTSSRTIAFQVDDGSGVANLSALVTRDVTITAVNDKPVVTTSAGTASYTEQDTTPVVVDPDIDVTDVDSVSLASATVSVVGVQPGDVLDADVSATTIGKGYVGGVLTLTGTAPIATYLDVLKTVTFVNTSNTNPGTSRQIQFKVNDGSAFAAESDPAFRTVDITNVNSAPVVTTSVGSTSYTENDPAVTVDGALTVTDVDSANLAGGTVKISGNFQAGDELAAATVGGVSGSFSGDTLTVSGTGTVAEYQTFLRGVTFRTTDDTPDTGDRTIAFQVDDGELVDHESNVATKTMTVAATNDAPVNTLPAAKTIAEDGGLTLSGGDAPTIADADLGASPIQVTLSATNGTLTLAPFTGLSFTSGDGSGDMSMTFSGSLANVHTALDGLAYAPTANYHGAATITMTSDDLGASGGGGAKTDTDAINVTITPVNDAPVLTQPDGALPYTEDSPSENHELTVAPNLTVTDVDTGDQQATATVTLTGRETGDGLTFTAGGGVTGSYDSGTGVLSLSGAASDAAYQTVLRSVKFRTTNDAPTTAARTVTFKVNDGDVDSNQVSRTINVIPTNDAPVADDETFDNDKRAIGNTSLVVDDPTDGAPNPTGVQKTVSGDILDGDTDVDTPLANLSVHAETKGTNGGGTVTIEADGDFTYLGEQGCQDTTDYFDYTLRDNDADLKTDVGRVNLTSADCVWYFDASLAADPPAATGGTSTLPYKGLVPISGPGGAGDQDAANDIHFMAPGTYAGGMSLESGQKVFSARHGLALSDGGAGTTVLQAPDGGAASSLIVGGLFLDADNTIQGMDVGTNGGTSSALTASTNVGSATINTVTSGTINNPTGGALRLTGGGTVNAKFASIVASGTSTTHHIQLTNINGSIQADAGALSGAAGSTVAISGGAANVTLGTTLTQNNADPIVDISGTTGGTKDFNAALTDAAGNGGGVALANNTGGTIRFDGGLSLNTGASNGFSATGGGTVAVTDPASTNNTIDTGTGTALNVANTSIHADDLTFERISSNGAPSGIVLNTTGSSGDLFVTGTTGTCAFGAATCTGGTIQGSTGVGVLLNSVGGGVSLTRTQILNGGDDGIRATSVADLTLNTVLVQANGNAAQERGLDYTNVTGASGLTATQVRNSHTDNVRVDNNTGTLDFNVDGNSLIHDSQNGDGIQFRGAGNAAMKADVVGTTFTSNFDDAFQLVTDNVGATGTMDLNFNTNQLSADASHVSAGALLTISPTGNTTTRANVTGNTIASANGSNVILNPAGSSTFDATVTGNTVNSSGGISIWGKPAQNAVSRMRIANNIVNGYIDRGIVIRHGEGGGDADFQVVGNTFSNPGPSAYAGIYVESGALGTDTVDVCAQVGGSGGEANNLTNSAPASGFEMAVAVYANSTLRLPGYTGTTEPDLKTYFQGRNTGLVDFIRIEPKNPVNTAGSANCQTPTLPPAP